MTNLTNNNNDNKYGILYKPQASTISICELKGNGHIPSSKRMSNVKMSFIALRDIPGYYKKTKSNENL